MRIVVIGEGMIEIAAAVSGARIGHGGDTLNTAIHLARSGHDVAFATGLGADAESDALRTAWAAEGIDPDLIVTDPARGPGLYMIRNRADGERSFTYWRDTSAARAMFDLPGSAAMVAAAARADVLVYSLITLAILPPVARETLFGLCRTVRARGGQVVFDGNYRARLWPDVATAVTARDAALGACDIGLPTLDDEAALGIADAAAVADHWRARGVGEVVVKLGSGGALVNGRVVPPPQVVAPVDSSGAGDAFNAAYLSARLGGADAAAAAVAGHRLAAWVVLQRGAIPARTPAAPY